MESLSGLRIAVYARFSSDAQRDSSIDAQVKLVREHVEKFGGTINPEFICTDRAISGSSNKRDDFDRLLKLIEARSIDVVATESADRLSRDLGDSDRLWKLARFNNVRLICVSDGIDSLSRGSRLQYGIKSLIADEYIEDLKSKTLRGLKNHFDRAQCTGGLPYGYTTKPIMNGGREPDGYEILIDKDKAALVVRIFRMYAEGRSLLDIATAFNSEGIPPPRANSKKSKAPKFWRKETIYAMLSNRTYLGEFTFGTRQWRRDPITRRRTYVKNDGQEIQRDSRPHLAIVPVDLFETANSRRKSVGARKTSGRKTSHPFSGLLFCFACGSRMVHVGGKPHHYYKCNAAHSGGTCSNKQLIRDDRLIAAAFAELRTILDNDELWQSVRSEIEERIKNHKSETASQRATVQHEVDRLDTEIARLVRFIATTDADSGSYEAVRDALEVATAKRTEAAVKLAAIRDKAPEAPRVPTMVEVRRAASDLARHVRTNPTSFREFLRTSFLADGRIVMEPLPDGGYKAHSAILPLRLPAPSKAKGPTGAGPSGALVRVSCGGRI